MIQPIVLLLTGFAILVSAPRGSFADEPPLSSKAANHQIEANVVSGGGVTGSSTTYRHQGTLGQPHPAGVGNTTEVTLWSGFWRAQLSLIVSPVPEFAPLTDKLWQNSPNPFNPMTTIKFSITEAARVQLAVFNVRGQKVRTLVDGSLAAGVYNEVWDGRDDNGGQSASGVYFYRLINGNSQQTEKMLLVK